MGLGWLLATALSAALKGWLPWKAAELVGDICPVRTRGEMACPGQWIHGFLGTGIDASWRHVTSRLCWHDQEHSSILLPETLTQTFTLLFLGVVQALRGTNMLSCLISELPIDSCSIPNLATRLRHCLGIAM